MPDEHDDHDHDAKPFAVVGKLGSGWGRYATIEQAIERADDLGRGPHGQEFTVMKRVTSSQH